MTVTPRNVDQIAQVIRDCRDYGFGMFSFQPAAFVGDERRWHDEYGDTTGDRLTRTPDGYLLRIEPGTCVCDPASDHRLVSRLYDRIVNAERRDPRHGIGRPDLPRIRLQEGTAVG